MGKNYSVLMSVYYKEQPEYLRRAIQSMMDQTVRTDDFVLVCDGPLNHKLDFVIEQFQQSYPNILNVYRLEKNQGLGNALNAGLKKCKNEFVARMDSDDISLSDRCERQLDLFEKIPDLSLCSGAIAEFEDVPEHIISRRSLPTDHTALVAFAKKRNPMNHMAVMFCKSKVLEAGGYIEIKLAEDYYLWVRMICKGCILGNLEQILVYARVGNGMYERRGGKGYAKSICQLQNKLLKLKFITYREFLVNCVVRILASAMPTSMRKSLYLKKLRG